MSRYYYKDDKLLSENGAAVMMGWERPIMKKVAEILTKTKGDVLNIGFGMGIVDTFIQEGNPHTHTIIESHPDVIEYMKNNGWESKSTCIFSKWQEQIGKIGPFDSIYMDTWGDSRVKYIPDLLSGSLKVGGKFLMWYNKDEFNMVIESLSDDYHVSYEYIPNNNLIPSQGGQHEGSGLYIDPSLDLITIPIITKLR